MAGWIKVYRDLENHWLWEDKPFSRGQAFINLLMMANHQDNKILFNGDLIEVKRGQRITSLRKLSEEWGWSTKKTKKFLELLEKDNMVTVKTDNKKTLVTIVNYGVYQDGGNTEETQRKQEGNSEETERKFKRNSKEIQKKTNKNDKELIKNDKEGEEGEEGKEVYTELLTFPTPTHEKIYNSFGDVSFKTWFVDSEITENETTIDIKVKDDFKSHIIKQRYADKLEILLNKEIEVLSC